MEFILFCFDPHPDLPPRGKEFLTFPPWGEMKGGINHLKSVTEILKYNTAVRQGVLRVRKLKKS